MLIVKVIIAVVVNQTVGVVIPVCVLGEMILVTVKLGVEGIVALTEINIREVNL